MHGRFDAAEVEAAFERTFASVAFAVIGGPGAPNHDAFVAAFGAS